MATDNAIHVGVDQIGIRRKPRAQIALIGNPNAGKSTLFNRLTGLRQSTGNFPGVTWLGEDHTDALIVVFAWGPGAETLSGQIDNTDIVVLCKLALTDADTRAWLNSERARIDSIRQLMEVDVLVRLWGADYDASSPTAVSAFLSSLPSREESFCTELLIKKTPGSGLNDAMRSLLRLEIKEVENRMEVAKGKLRSAGLADSVMTQTINAVMLLKKELVEKQKSLRNIA